jgi:uncharacterized protein YdeI (YjbR/CyaY-like superfamily)
MDDKNYMNSRVIPIGLGMALAQNIDAMNYFSSLDHGKQQQVIDQTHEIRSNSEMRQFVSHLVEGNSFR